MIFVRDQQQKKRVRIKKKLFEPITTTTVEYSNCG